MFSTSQDCPERPISYLNIVTKLYQNINQDHWLNCGQQIYIYQAHEKTKHSNVTIFLHHSALINLSAMNRKWTGPTR